MRSRGSFESLKKQEERHCCLQAVTYCARSAVCRVVCAVRVSARRRMWRNWQEGGIACSLPFPTPVKAGDRVCHGLICTLLHMRPVRRPDDSDGGMAGWQPASILPDWRAACLQHRISIGCLSPGVMTRGPWCSELEQCGGRHSSLGRHRGTLVHHANGEKERERNTQRQTGALAGLIPTPPRVGLSTDWKRSHTRAWQRTGVVSDGSPFFGLYPHKQKNAMAAQVQETQPAPSYGDALISSHDHEDSVKVRTPSVIATVLTYACFPITGICSW
jgi:hypothetical protein